MISDFIIINSDENTPIYIQIYRAVKKAIENGQIKENEKLPSVRKLCADLGVSKTTVESAYNLLCAQGYIISKPQKGYFAEKGIYIKKNSAKEINKKKEEIAVYKYDFSGKGIDNGCSNIKEWKKYVKEILNKDYLLNSYSENQGEAKLRMVIERYAFGVRGVVTNYDSIVIGSGSQTLIYILCGMLGINKTVAIEKNTYPQAEQVFKDFNYNIKYTENDEISVSIRSLEKIKPDILLINPNTSSKNNTAMPIKRRIEIINWAKENNCLIIEDDYNGELRYKTHPSASIQSYGEDCTVYIGSFSKILLPSVRISYMALPEKLLKSYLSVKENYNQTTSKTEQLALAQYINDGKLEKHLRKARRYYNLKSDIMLNSIKKYYSNYSFNETSMYFEIPVKNNCSDALKLLRNAGVNVMGTSSDNTLRLSFSQIDSDLIDEGVKLTAETTFL